MYVPWWTFVIGFIALVTIGVIWQAGHDTEVERLENTIAELESELEELTNR